MNERNKGFVLLHGSILILGGTGLFAKLIPLPATDITFWRSLIAVVLLFIVHRVQQRSIRLQTHQDSLRMLFCGMLLGIHWATFFHAMQLAGIAIGMIALYTYPIITVFVEPLFKGQKPHPLDIVSALLMLVGIIILVPEPNLSNQTTQGVCWGVFSALLFALRNIMQRHYLSAYRGDTSILYQGFVAALIVLPLTEYGIPELTTENWFKVLLLGAIFTALPHALFASSLRYLSAKTVGLVACLQPVYGTVLAWLVLAEQPTHLVIIGGVIIVGTAALETYRTS